MVGIPGTWVAQTLLRPRNLGVLAGRRGLEPQCASSHLHPVVLTSLYLPVDLIVYLIISCVLSLPHCGLPGSRDLVWCDHPCLSLEQRLQHSRLKSEWKMNARMAQYPPVLSQATLILWLTWFSLSPSDTNFVYCLNCLKPFMSIHTYLHSKKHCTGVLVKCMDNRIFLYLPVSYIQLVQFELVNAPIFQN